MIFSGDDDSICATLGTQQFIWDLGCSPCVGAVQNIFCCTATAWIQRWRFGGTWNPLMGNFMKIQDFPGTPRPHTHKLKSEIIGKQRLELRNGSKWCKFDGKRMKMKGQTVHHSFKTVGHYVSPTTRLALQEYQQRNYNKHNGIHSCIHKIIIDNTYTSYTLYCKYIYIYIIWLCIIYVVIRICGIFF